MQTILLRDRNLPDFPRGAGDMPQAAQRGEMLRILQREVYGVTPAFDGPLYAFVEARDPAAFGGRAAREWIRLSFPTPGGMYSFGFELLYPRQDRPLPAFIHLSFGPYNPARPDALGECAPAEEILDNGYALANLYYENVTSDTPAQDGLARADPAHGPHAWGKIGMWAFAASRVMDYLLTRPEIDGARVAVCGWSRLGKTALWCGAQDERFSLVISTQSGCGGAALMRGKAGERVGDITRRFGYWFCANYARYAGKEDVAPFDQHFLLACVAPRALFIGSAQEDEWADPLSEYLCAEAASRAYRALGARGFISQGQPAPAPEQALFDGEIGYLMRRGGHAVIRADWLAHMRFRQMRGV